jgi:hypothetical protein
VWSRELARAASAVRAAAPRSGATRALAQTGIESRGLAAAGTLDAMMGAGTLPPFSSEDTEDLPSRLADLPPWWRQLAAPWDAALARAAAPGGRPPCMFACTARGCSAGAAACLASHDSAREAAVREAKRQASSGGK